MEQTTSSRCQRGEGEGRSFFNLLLDARVWSLCKTEGEEPDDDGVDRDEGFREYKLGTLRWRWCRGSANLTRHHCIAEVLDVADGLRSEVGIVTKSGLPAYAQNVFFAVWSACPFLARNSRVWGMMGGQGGGILDGGWRCANLTCSYNPSALGTPDD